MKSMILASAICASLGACGVLAPKGPGTVMQGTAATAAGGQTTRVGTPAPNSNWRAQSPYAVGG